MEKNWKIWKIFKQPTNAKKIKFINVPLETPVGFMERLREDWNKQLEKKRRILEQISIHTIIKEYEFDKTWNALYQKADDKLEMWPGPGITPREITETKSDSIEIQVSQTFFPLTEALQDKKTSAVLAQTGIKIRPTLAIMTFLLTTDNKLLLTVRGDIPSRYPNRLYGPGGDPLYVNTNIVKHQQDELLDEVLITPNEYDSNNFKFVGVCLDNEKILGKPDLVGWIPINLNLKEIKEKFYRRALSQRPGDAVDIKFVDASESGLLNYLKQSKLTLFNPPTHATLVLFGFFNFGKEWLQKLKMN